MMDPSQIKINDVFVLVPSLEEFTTILDNLDSSACTRPGRGLRGSKDCLILKQRISSLNLCPEEMSNVKNIPNSNSFQGFTLSLWNMETGESSQDTSINNHEIS